MRGLIRARDVIIHPLVVIQGFGVKVFWRALTAPKERTFLELISEGIPQPISPEQVAVSHQLDRLILHETHCSKIYHYFADHFTDALEVRDFFKTLSYQEEAHAEIVRVAKVEIARQKTWPKGDLIAPEILEKVDLALAQIDAVLRKTPKVSLKQALEILEEIEMTEKEMVFAFIHHFHVVMQFTFLKKIHHLIPSFADHHAYLNTTLPLIKEWAARRERRGNRNNHSV